MGFGLLLCGYFVLFMMSFGMGEYSFAALLIGGFISFNATVKLKDYCPSFTWTAVMSALYFLFGLWGAVSFVNDMLLLDLPIFGGVAKSAADYVKFGLELAYHLCMLYSVFELSGQLGVKKIRSRALFEMIFMSALGVFQLLIYAIPSLANVENQMPTKFLILFTLVAYIINLFVLYSCYNNICPEGEEMGKERKPSRFKFINNIREKMEEKEARAVRESLEYIKEKQEKKNKKREQRRRR
ncbi:MAG: hypothetical protein IJX74_00325 [Clostridia bacterium]|nr:hypothetical protein [Clostridia bacterium]